MKPLKIGITGVRGIVGETFTPELAVDFAESFGTYLDRGRILVCRDTRPSGPMIRSAVLAGLLAAGCEVIDLGVCPTPSMQLAVQSLKADGGIAITAGHNPWQWNALKFVRSDGLYLNPTQGEELLDIFHQGEFAKASWNEIKQLVQKGDAIEEHINVLHRSFAVETIRAKKLTVAVDCCNGACSFLSPKWLAFLGCEVLAVNDNPSAPFPHAPEPKPETMAQLCAVVKAGRAAIGFAHDADGERLGIVTDLGEPLSEEMTLAIAADIRLRKKRGTVVTNVSTSSAVDMSSYLGGRADKVTHQMELNRERAAYFRNIESVMRHDIQLAINAGRARSAVYLAQRLVDFQADSENLFWLAESYRALGPRTQQLTEKELTNSAKKDASKKRERRTIEEEERELLATPAGQENSFS